MAKGITPQVTCTPNQQNQRIIASVFKKNNHITILLPDWKDGIGRILTKQQHDIILCRNYKTKYISQKSYGGTI